MDAPLAPKEVAVILGVSTATLSRMRKDGIPLKWHRIGKKRVVYFSSEVAEYQHATLGNGDSENPG